MKSRTHSKSQVIAIVVNEFHRQTDWNMNADPQSTHHEREATADEVADHDQCLLLGDADRYRRYQSW